MLAFTVLYSFIKDHSSVKIDYFEGEKNWAQYPPTSNIGLLTDSLTTFIRINKKRDKIANQIWTDYVFILSFWGKAV